MQHLPYEICLKPNGEAANLPEDFNGVETRIKLMGYVKKFTYGTFFLHNGSVWYYDARDAISVRKVEFPEKPLALIRYATFALVLGEHDIYWLEASEYPAKGSKGYFLTCLEERKPVKYFISDCSVFYFEDVFLCKVMPSIAKGKYASIKDKMEIPEHMGRLEEITESIVYDDDEFMGGLTLKDGRSACISFRGPPHKISELKHNEPVKYPYIKEKDHCLPRLVIRETPFADMSIKLDL